MNLATTLFKHTSYLRGKRDLLLSIKRAKAQIKGVKKSNSAVSQKMAQSICDLRGRPMFYPAIFSGLGNGALTELVDGSVKYDLITGIGTHYFGHSDLDLISTAVEAASKNVLMQGNLQSSPEVEAFSSTLLKMSGKRLKYVWPSLTGSMANDNALKMIRQKKSPASKVIAFKDCFHGRSLLMTDITDNDAYRIGLPRYESALYIPFYDAADPKSIEKSEKALKDILSEHKNEVCAFLFELVQGEGGFKQAPREFFVRLMDICKEANLGIWIDEIQTFARTGELYAFQKLKLEQYVDMVTVGKMLQNCATLYTEEYNPKPGLIAGTFCGSTVSLAVAKRILERLKEESFFGAKGKLSQIEKWAVEGLQNLQNKVGRDVVSNIDAIGAMVSWQFKDGSMENTKKLIMQSFDEGVMAFSCGRGPYKIRFLLPAGIIKETEYSKALNCIEKAIKKVN